MNKLHRGMAAGILFVVAALAGSRAQAQDIKVNWRTQAPFSDYRTFALVPGQQDGFWTQFVPKYLKSALQSRGLNAIPATDHPDVKVVYHFLRQDVMDSTTTSDGFGWGGGPWGGWGGFGGGGYGGGFGPDISQTRAQPRTMGILTIDLVDARTNQVVWRGQATEDSVASTQHGDEDQVWKSIGKMFQHYPPKPDKKK